MRPPVPALLRIEGRWLPPRAPLRAPPTRFVDRIGLLRGAMYRAAIAGNS